MCILKPAIYIHIYIYICSDNDKVLRKLKIIRDKAHKHINIKSKIVAL